jgi:four helix bundle protein
LEVVMGAYQELEVWQEAMTLAEELYRETVSFPREERYGLTAQLRRAGVSIPSNIAEGYGREATQEWIRFLRIAQGSLKELETQLLLASRLGFLSPAAYTTLSARTVRISHQLRALIKSLAARLH